MGLTPIQVLIRATREIIGEYGYELYVTHITETEATWVILAPWPTPEPHPN